MVCQIEQFGAEPDDAMPSNKAAQIEPSGVLARLVDYQREPAGSR
jgi:hypothetical protein